MPFIDLNPETGGTGTGDATVTFDAVFPSSITTGDVVYISGPKVGSLFTVDLVDYTSLVQMPAIGVVISKTTSTTGVIMVTGEITGLYTGLTVNKYLFIDDSSRLSTTPPGAPVAGIVLNQPMGRVLSSDTIYLKPEVPKVRVSG